MQTSTTQRKPKARTMTADSKLPYPEYREVDSADADSRCQYWLACWMRSQAQYEFIFNKLFKRATSLRVSEIEADSLWQAIHRTRDEAERHIKILRDVGGLPFAWAGTTHPAVQS